VVVGVFIIFYLVGCFSFQFCLPHRASGDVMKLGNALSLWKSHFVLAVIS